MAQRDYVRRGQSTSTRRKKNTSRKKQRNQFAISPAMVAIAAAIVVTFIGGLYFVAHHKKEEAEALQSHKVTGNGLPPKPEERWRYIKELESRQPSARAPTEPSAGGEILHPEQLTDEQRQLLEQMQADMRQQPTQLNEVPWNGNQDPARRAAQQQLQQNNSQPRATQQQWNSAEQQRVQSRTESQPYQQRNTSTQQTQRNEPYQDLIKTPPRNTATTQHENKSAQTTAITPPAAEKKDQRRWMIQCGSFKGAAQAESVRAQLAFEGFDSHLTTNNGWNRVVIGPIKGKESTDNTLSRLKMSGHTNCIRLVVGG